MLLWIQLSILSLDELFKEPVGAIVAIVAPGGLVEGEFVEWKVFIEVRET